MYILPFDFNIQFSSKVATAFECRDYIKRKKVTYYMSFFDKSVSNMYIQIDDERKRRRKPPKLDWRYYHGRPCRNVSQIEHIKCMLCIYVWWPDAVRSSYSLSFSSFSLLLFAFPSAYLILLLVVSFSFVQQESIISPGSKHRRKQRSDNWDNGSP